MFKQIAGMTGILMLAGGVLLIPGQEKVDPIQDLRAQVKRLEERVRGLESALQTMSANSIPADLRAKVSARFAEDRKTFTAEEFQKIENAFLDANKLYGTPASIELLKKFVTQYSSANRVGCALLYLGQMTKGSESEQYLKQAIADYSNTFYGDGVQVGAYARFMLGMIYRNSGRPAEAEALFSYIRKNYPDAVAHGATPLAPMIPKSEY